MNIMLIVLSLVLFYVTAHAIFTARTPRFFKRFGPYPLNRGKAALGTLLSVFLFFTGVINSANDTAEKHQAEQTAATEKTAAAKEAIYQAAVDLQAKGEWSDAIAEYRKLEGYKDVADRITSSLYDWARTAVEIGKHKEAWDLLKDVPDTFKPDVVAMRETAYTNATAALWEQANTALAEVDTNALALYQAEAPLLALTSMNDSDAKAELERVQKQIAEREAAEKAKEEAIAAERGPRPENSEWDAAVKEVTAFLRKNLKDPDSIQYDEWSPVSALELNGKHYWAVRVRYRAKNSFGGYVLSNQVFLIQHGRIVDHFDF